MWGGLSSNFFLLKAEALQTKQAGASLHFWNLDVLCDLPACQRFSAPIMVFFARQLGTSQAAGASVPSCESYAAFVLVVMVLQFVYAARQRHSKQRLHCPSGKPGRGQSGAVVLSLTQHCQAICCGICWRHFLVLAFSSAQIGEGRKAWQAQQVLNAHSLATLHNPRHQEKGAAALCLICHLCCLCAAGLKHSKQRQRLRCRAGRQGRSPPGSVKPGCTA